MPTLFSNANLVLDGFADLQKGFNVLIRDGRIAAVSTQPIEAGAATVIDVGGRTLMPGLIDAHAHITGLSLTPKNIANPAADIAIASANYLRNCLMDGYTTIRAVRAISELTDLPIIAVTAKAMKGDREKCLDAGASDYLCKPVEAEHLRSTLRLWLHR